ncbi:hypothetical protein SO802_015461 [Lithocarpus litseifolius]|uniref:Uncharacterized protein n=1 Tax=Lithocarpus litseifolius TaxID=425828 RepID=A0AAW2CTR8_9ROSI
MPLRCGKEKTGHSPSRIELFDITHVQANGQAVNEPTQDALVALRNLTTQVNEGALQISQDQMFVEVFGPERHGRVRGYGAGVTPTKLWGSSSSRIMYDLEKRLQESEQKRLEAEQKCLEAKHIRIEADAELKEQVKHLKSMLEQQAIEMAKQRRHFEEQRASQMAEQRAHYDNMMMQMLSYVTSQSAQSSSDH